MRRQSLREFPREKTKVIWLKKLPSELHFPHKKACKLFNDNKAAISISGNPVQHNRTKHVEIDKHFIKKRTWRKKDNKSSLCKIKRPTSRHYRKLLNKHCTS